MVLQDLFKKFEKWEDLKTKAYILEKKIQVSKNSQELQKLIIKRDTENAMKMYNKINDEATATNFNQFIEEEISTCIKHNYIKRMKNVFHGVEKSKEIYSHIFSMILKYFEKKISDEQNVNDIIKKYRYVINEFPDLKNKLCLTFFEKVDAFMETRVFKYSCVDIDKWIEEFKMICESGLCGGYKNEGMMTMFYSEMEMKYVALCKENLGCKKRTDMYFIEERVMERVKKYGTENTIFEIENIFNNLDSI